VEGFLLLGTHDLEEAQQSFERALAADPQYAEAFLGLGLARFARGDDDGGLEALLAATTLAPRVALYQSYLGKAYAELERFPEALAVLASAGRIDPRDPTPHLYASLIQRDLNRQSVAIEELSEAMAKNDFRAVYRSRLLLDQDQATRGASLAQLYSDVGFEAYGAHHAVRSLELDYANASAHLFAAGTLGALPDRTSAAASEFLLARILLPVSQNAFTTFNEYTSLFSRPGYTGTLAGDSDFLGSDEKSATIYGGNDRYAVFATAIDTTSSEPLGPNSDLDQQVGGFFGKFAIGSRSSLLLDAQVLDAREGLPGAPLVLFDESGSGLAIRLLQSDDPDLDRRLFAKFREYVVGYHLGLGPGQNLLLAVEHGTEELRTNDPDFYHQPEFFPPSVFGCGDEHGSEDRTRSAQLAYHLNRGRHELIVGGEVVRTELENWRNLFCLTGPFAGEVDEIDRLEGDSRSSSAHARYSFHSRRGSSFAVGGRYDEFEDEDIFVGSAFGPGQVLAARESRLSPHLGVTVPLRAGFQLRMAAFRSLAVHNRPAVAPSLIAGFALRRAEDLGTIRDEAAIALEQAASPRLFWGLTAFHREVQAPTLRLDANFDFVRFLGEFDVDGARLDLNRRLSRELTLNGETQWRRIDAHAFLQNDLQTKAGLGWVSPRGWFGTLQQTYLRQRFDERLSELALPDSRVWLTDVSLAKELPGKRGLVAISVGNVLDEDFNVVIEGLSVVQRLPGRDATLSIEWYF
jgi:tetratricopeptide (TPR) repeat protein